MNMKPHKVRVLERNGSVFLVEVNGKTVSVKFKSLSHGKTVMLEINGKVFSANFIRVHGNSLKVGVDRKHFDVQLQPKIPKEHLIRPVSVVKTVKKSAASLVVEKDAVTAPIAGRIVLLKADVGRKVEKGACICVLEAMKMQNEVTSHKAGTVKEIRVSAGTVVNKGEVLAVIS